MLGAKSSVLGFSRPTDSFLSVAWRKSVVYGMPAIVGAQRTNSTGKVAKWALHVPAPVGNSVAPHVPPRAPLAAHMEKLRCKAVPAAQLSSPCCARIEQNRTFHRRYLVGSSRYRYRELAAQDAALHCAECKLCCAGFAVLHRQNVRGRTYIVRQG